MNTKMLNKIIFVIIFITTMILNISTHGKERKDQEYINNTLIELKIIDDNNDMDQYVTRAEFAKIIVKSSKYKDIVSDYISESVCNDVGIDTPNASYIKKAIETGYMYTYLGGYFKPYDYVKYEDLTRACLALLSYTNEDFKSNQVISRNQKFNNLNLNKNIEKEYKDVLNKQDIVNGIYNTLNGNIKDKDTIYAKTIFEKIIIDSDKEINSSEYKETKIDGPFFAKKESDISYIPFELNNHNVYINGLRNTVDDLKDDIINYGYAIYYIDLDNKLLYAYTERQDITAPIMVRKGYIYRIHYSASDMTVPYRVDIDNYKYMIDSEQAKFDFSASGCFKEDDEIVYLCNKMNDVSSAYIDKNGKKIYENDETEPYNGSIIIAFNINYIK